MGDIVNLRRFRKSRDRTERAEDGARNRAAFGRTREEREASADNMARAAARLDGHRLGSPDADPRHGAPDADPRRKAPDADPRRKAPDADPRRKAPDDGPAR